MLTITRYLAYLRGASAWIWEVCQDELLCQGKASSTGFYLCAILMTRLLVLLDAAKRLTFSMFWSSTAWSTRMHVSCLWIQSSNPWTKDECGQTHAIQASNSESNSFWRFVRTLRKPTLHALLPHNPSRVYPLATVGDVLLSGDRLHPCKHPTWQKRTKETGALLLNVSPVRFCPGHAVPGVLLFGLHKPKKRKKVIPFRSSQF